VVVEGVDVATSKLPGVSILLVEVAAVLSGLEPGDVDGGKNASEGVFNVLGVAVVVDVLAVVALIASKLVCGWRVVRTSDCD
jgi:hypothetical protein